MQWGMYPLSQFGFPTAAQLSTSGQVHRTRSISMGYAIRRVIRPDAPEYPLEPPGEAEVSFRGDVAPDLPSAASGRRFLKDDFFYCGLVFAVAKHQRGAGNAYLALPTITKLFPGVDIQHPEVVPRQRIISGTRFVLKQSVEAVSVMP